MATKKSNIEGKAIDFLFQKPLEPVFTTRDDGKGSFDLPSDFYTDRYKNEAVELQSRFGENVDIKIPVRDIIKPDISFAKKIGRKQQFSLFNDKHKQVASRLIQIFMDAPDVDSFIATAAFVRDRINPLLFEYAFSVSVQHRPDTANFNIRPIAEQFPSNFVEPSVFKEARAEGTIIQNPGNRRHIEIPQNFTASEREEEQRMAYFREDIGVNMHHWHWHLVYPTEGPFNIINKDRRGELFYYMHHQIIARYNAERFCNLLPKVKILNNLRDPIPEGYFPKIISSLNNRTYPGRAEGTRLRDIEREDNMVEISDIERWRDRVHQAIDQGFVTDSSGKNIPLDEEKGIDILGNIIEASALSPNRQLYGNLHNMGHNMISFAHDPDYRHLEDFGVMGDVTTAMRDPIFYRWHAFIDSIFSKYKATLPSYSQQQLSYDGVIVEGFEVKITSAQKTPPNILLTFWKKSDVDLAAGLDFGPSGSIYAKFVHLQHTPFAYSVLVNNNSGAPKMGTCRIFMCPKADERGTPLKFNEQRLLAVEMDKFTVNLMPGQNMIRRLSTESSVTIPFERTFRRVGQEYQPKDGQGLAVFQFCGCGWPHHLLIPKGNAAGMPFDFFVMISDYSGDAVDQSNNSPDVCGDAHSFCGLKDKLYPDKRAMGYPFDRVAPVETLQNFAETFPNMKLQEVKIQFTDKIIDRN